MPIVLYVAMNSEILISVALGETWLPTADILRPMALAGFAWPLTCLTGTVMTSFGYNRQYIWLGVGSAFTLSLTFVAGSFWGAMGTAVAFAIWTYSTLVPILWFSLRSTPVSFMDSLAPAIKPAIATAATYLITTIVFNEIKPLDEITELAVSVPAFSTCYLLVWFIQPEGRAILVRYFGYATIGRRTRAMR
jgi:PST family polysaccharide transporter